MIQRWNNYFLAAVNVIALPKHISWMLMQRRQSSKVYYDQENPEATKINTISGPYP